MTKLRYAVGCFMAGASALAMLPATGAAQELEPGVARDEAAEPTTQDIIVTGTLLRGAPPVGSNVIAVGQEKAQAQGATTSNELLATVPQVSNLFNSVPNATLGIAANRVQVARPSLRNLSNPASSSNSTLVLFDGHRIAPVGVAQNAVDPDLIPSAAIERVEIVPDGGSATYGSDAVGGVINFITRKRFDGLQVQGRYGFADDYYQVEASAIAGKDWGSGSLFVSYTYQHNDALFGRDRGYVRQVDWLSPDLRPTGRFCSPGNVQIARNVFALPDLTSTTPNVCDGSDDASFIPSATRHGVIGGLHQELSDWLTVDVRGFYGERESTMYSPFRGSVTVTGGANVASPRQFYYTPVPGQSATANQTVFFDFAPLLGRNSAPSTTSFQEWGTNVEFAARLSDAWQLRTLFNYSHSNSEYHLQQFNQTLLNAAARATTQANAVNFYNPTAADLPLIEQIVNSEDAGQGKYDLFNIRTILDGTLFTLPGGEVKVAAGYEYLRDSFSQRIVPANQPTGALDSIAFTPYTRQAHAFFGELQVPLIGEGNRPSFIHSLTLAGSVRYDHFNDFGSTTNPKFGITLKPVSWLGLRGSYSTSFNAPSLVDQLGTLRTLASFGTSSFNQPFVRPGDSPSKVGLVSITGSRPGLKPQTAKTFSFGLDIEPPFVEGLRASVSYYQVKFKNIIGIPSPDPTIYTNFPDNIYSDPNGLFLGDIREFLANSNTPNQADVLNQILPRCDGLADTDRCDAYALIDFRQGNYGAQEVRGLDFSTNYRANTGFGGIDASVSGNYQLHRRLKVGNGSPWIDELVPPGNVSRLKLQATLGVDVGSFRAQATLNHSSGYRVLRCDPTTIPACLASTTGVPTGSGRLQDKVGAFNTVNLFFKYDVPGESAVLKDLSVTLNINNLLDQDPPIFREVGSRGTANGGTLGRLVQLGLSKKF